MEDARRREEADRVREDGRKRFAQEIRDRVEGLRDAVRSVKGELLAKGTPKPRTLFYPYSIVFLLTLSLLILLDGLTSVFATIKHTENVRDLPDNYQAVLEWARISYV